MHSNNNNNNNSNNHNGRQHYNSHKWRIGPVLFAVLCFFCVSYLWIMLAVFEPTSIAINLHHLRDLRYLLNSDRCPESSRSHFDLVLLLVGSHPSHAAVRQVIRKSWGNPGIPDYHFKLVFLFGKLATDRENTLIAKESEQYGDIIQGDFNDSYYNVTMRDLMGFQWAWHSCRDAKYILRADDDIAFDVYRLMDILNERFSDPTTTDTSIGCYEIVERAIPRRYGRYAVSPDDFSGSYYASYCMGWLYVLTPPVGKRLVDVSLSTTPMWINDVHITGTLAKTIGLQLCNIGLKYSLEYRDMLDFAQSRSTIRLEMGPTRADANLTQVIQEIYKRNYAVTNGLIAA